MADSKTEKKIEQGEPTETRPPQHWEGIEPRTLKVDSLTFQVYCRWDTETRAWVWWVPAIGKFTQSIAADSAAVASMIQGYCLVDKHLPPDYESAKCASQRTEGEGQPK